ncbi:MAG: crossover junction endodeoxyribonuclease RuvC, partial [Betaproteobacteria bacterium]|nr:crossover junction endodeoxyribonuclease RuvC [Betaproteobacteria bacterium]
GRASKQQMQQMVTRLLSLPGQPGPDAADALGLAICHAHSMKSRAQLQAVSDKLGALGGQLGKKGLRVKRGRLV